MIIQQGDQYTIPIKIKFGDDVVTPDNCTDVRVKIADTLLDYSSEGITYDEDTESWCFPITEDMSFDFYETVFAQVAVKVGTDFVYSKPKKIDVGHSIIEDRWS